MTSFKKYFSLLGSSVFVASFLLMPAVSFADTSTPVQTKVQALSTELSQIRSDLLAGAASTTATFTLSQGQSIQQATSSASGGILLISLPHFLHSNPDPSLPPIIPQTITHYAQITLQYEPCVASSPVVCIAMASSSYPVMTSELSQGADTGYLHYIITLTSLGTSTATFTITDSSFLSPIQTKINELADQIKALLG